MRAPLPNTLARLTSCAATAPHRSQTCGGKFDYPKGRITEICIIIHDGLQVTDKFSTLINPECYISPLYTNITGITNQMVTNAPKFNEVANTILQLTENRIFVAHNISLRLNFTVHNFSLS